MRRRELLLTATAMMAAPGGLRAQQKAMPVIGLLGSTSTGANVLAFRQGLSDAGYLEGQNVAIEPRWAEGRHDRLPALAAELVGQKVDVIVTMGGTPPALAAKNATSTIPIVFSTGDPVERGLVASLARPGGNLTGVSIMLTELMPKRLDLLSQLAQQAGVIALLVNPNNAIAAEPMIRNVREAARAKGLQFHILKAGTESEIEAAYAALAQLRDRALLVTLDPLFNNRIDQLVALAARYVIPAIYASRDFAAAGGLMSYGPSLVYSVRQQGVYAGKILNGAKPADLPVEQPTTFELVVNLNTAKALGLLVPPSILARADEVIE